MTTSKQACPACGAPGSARICAFCGTLLVAPVDTSEENEALDEFHHLLAGQSEKEKQVEFLQHGFIPEDPSNLIDAGVRSVALIDFNANEGEPGNAAANRLRAITLKLKIMEATLENTRAIEEFERVLSKHERIEHRENIAIWVLILTVAFILLFGCILVLVVMVSG